MAITGDFVNGIHLMVGLSTDNKPETTAENTFFLEEDSGDVYYFSEGQWAEADSAVAGIVAALLNKGALPAVSADDNGKVLGVENGVWTPVEGGGGGSGVSPVVTLDETDEGVTISVTDVEGTKTAEVKNGTATDEQVEESVEGWLDEHPEATTTVEDGSITDAKLVQTNGVLSRVNAIKDEAAMCKLTASDFQRGYWSGSSIASSTTRICSKTLIPVLAGDILTLDEQSIYLGAWLYVNGDTSVEATELLGYTTPKPQYYTFTQSGLLVIQGRKHNSSTAITASDFIGSVTIQHKIVRDVVNNTTVVDIVEEKGFTRRTLGQSQFARGYWSGGSIVSSYERICSKEWYSLNSGDSIIYQSNVAELGIWAQGDSDAEAVNIVPYAPSIQKTKITFSEHTLVMFQLKATAGNISPSDFDARVSIQRFGNTYDGLAELYLGKMIQANGAADGITSSTTRMVMKSVLALPYGDRTKLTVKVNYGFKVGVRVGASPYDLGDNLYWFYDGDTIPLPAGSNFYRLGIAKLGDTTITVDDLADAGLHVYYEPHEVSFAPFDGAANACMLDVPTGSSNMNYRTLPTFLHGSDMHGDYERVKRFAAFAEKLGVSMAAITGDLVPFNVFSDCNHFEWLHDIIKKSPVLWGLCVGNHDSHVGSGNSAYTMADADVYSIFYEPIKTEIGNATEKVWYVKDMTSQKIRVISLDLYQYGGVWTKTFFTQEQLTWLCTTLASTPQNYGVVILMHAQQLSVVKDESHAKFFQTVRKGETAEYYNAVDNDGDPIGDIVDAFIKKTTISQTYTQNSGADTLTVSGDFTSVASGVEFICYMTGHFHQDTIGYAPRPVGDPKQLVLNITCGVSAYGGSSYKYLADCSDMPRNQMDATQDAFNIYGIDRATKTVRVARIGSNMNQLMEERNFMVIPYAEVTE